MMSGIQGLTDLQVDILNYLWDMNGSSFKQLENWLNSTRGFSACLVKETVEDLESNQCLYEDGSHFLPLVSKARLQRARLSHLVSGLFSDSENVDSLWDADDQVDILETVRALRDQEELRA